MCCLFGLIDVKHQLSGAEKNRIISILAEASEARGTDATGYGCNSHGKLIIEKQPLPAHRMKFQIPKDSYVIMGHTRMTTQGEAQKNKNNHPFFGRVPDMPFALAHNGVLSNDTVLRKNHCLPNTKIETDSYVAVQLIEKQNSLDLESVKYMAEQVKGTFNFTILDRSNRLYIVKGNNPLCLYYFKKAGFYLYASTRPILEEALEEMGYDRVPHEEIKIKDGEILVIDAKGNITIHDGKKNFTSLRSVDTADGHFTVIENIDNGLFTVQVIQRNIKTIVVNCIQAIFILLRGCRVSERARRCRHRGAPPDPSGRK